MIEIPKVISGLRSYLAEIDNSGDNTKLSRDLKTRDLTALAKSLSRPDEIWLLIGKFLMTALMRKPEWAAAPREQVVGIANDLVAAGVILTAIGIRIGQEIGQDQAEKDIQRMFGQITIHGVRE